MSNNNGPDHIVVDGSNIATEGRSMPSLAQLSEAVMSFMDENPDTSVTVVVDATFGHRIDKKEVKEFEEGISNNELVAPPAGAVGRGDAFVLGIADKANASVLSNDSFQEFHGEYEWLFDEGRLIGGKPVPHVGWVWVDRIPVRGPISRKATGGRRGSRSSGSGSGSGRSRSGSGSRRTESDSTARTGSKEASGPMPVPKGPPPRKAAAKKAAAATTESSGGDESSRKPAPKGQDPVNDLMPFLEFVENHPVGTSISAVVDAYSSHGAYVTVDDGGVRCYVPLPMMADPTPRSAKSVMKMGDTVDLVVVSFAAARRSIDCAVPGLADRAIADAKRYDRDAVDVDVDADQIETETPKRSRTTATKKPTARKKPATRKTAAKKTAAKKKTATKTTPRKTATAKQRASSGSPAAKSTETSATKSTAAKKTASKKTAAKKAVTKKTATKKTATKKTATKKTATKKTAARKAPAKKTAAKKAPAKKAAAKKAASRKTTSTSAKKSAASQPASAATAKREATRKRRLAQSTGEEN